MLHCCCIREYRIPANVPQPKVPLVSVNISSIIQNSLATLTITQEYMNQELKPIECEYEFIKVEEFGVTSLKIILPDGSVLNSAIEDLETASEVYQDGIARGNTAVMGKLEQNEKMTVHIGNLGCGQKIKIEFTLVGPLESSDNFWKLVIPPSYLSNSVDFDFDFSVNIISNTKITDFSSNYDLQWQSDNETFVEGRLKPEDKYRCSEWTWVKFRSENGNIPSCIIQKQGEKYAAMMSFIPFPEGSIDFDDLEVPGEYIFLLDRSYSMAGISLKLAKEAVILFLKSLPQGSLFNIVSFGSKFCKMFEESKESSAFVDQAINEIQKFRADMVKTEIFQPLDNIFKSVPSKQFPRTIFLLTDGQVSNAESVVKLIKSQLGTSRVHTFGIGSEADPYLIKNCAEAGRGCHHFVSNAEEIGKKVISALRKSILPCFNTWEINWQGEAFPFTNSLGNVYFGERFIQYILLESFPNDDFSIQFFDNYQKQAHSFKINGFREIPGDQIFKLWAKNKIDHLSENIDDNKNEIIQISKNFQIPSKLTAFVCVKENSEASVEELQTRKVFIQTFKTNAQMSGIPPKLPVNQSNVPSNCAIAGPPKSSAVTTLPPKPQENYIPQSSEIARQYIPPPYYDTQKESAIEIMGSQYSIKDNKPPPLKDNVALTKSDRLPPPIIKMAQYDLDYSLSINESISFKSSRHCNKDYELDWNPSLSCMPTSSCGGRVNYEESQSNNGTQNFFHRIANLSYEQTSNPRRTVYNKQLYMTIVSLQGSDGTWEYDSVKNIIPKIQEISFDCINDDPEKPKIAATVYIICSLQKYFSNERDEWILLEKKAIRWLKAKNIIFGQVRNSIYKLI